jgi:phytoene dehydrogenase-like protein
VLENGDELDRRRRVVERRSALTFLKMVGEPSTCRRVRRGRARYKFRGSSGKVNLALDALPDFTCLPGRGRTCAARSRSRRASTTWSAPTTRRSTALLAAAVHRHGDPELTDPSVAPPGKHVMSCFVQYAPYT